MLNIHKIIIGALITTTCLSCSKEENDYHPDSYLEEFTSIESNHDTLKMGDSTTLRAIAEGSKLTYQWSTNSNAPLISIENEPEKIIFYADPCVGAGSNTVFCTIKAKNRQERKDLELIVIP